MRIILIEVPDIIDEKEYNKLLCLISSNKRAKIKNYLNIRDIYSSIIGELLIRYMVFEDIGHTEIFIKENEYGKPYIENSNLHYNVSHSGKWVICVMDTQEIGIDIEEYRKVNIECNKNIFTKNEYKKVICSKKPEREFIRLWTIKESYIKLIGKGLQIPLNSFEIEKNIIINNNTYYYKEYTTLENYNISLCSEKNKFPKIIEIKTLNDIIS